MFSSNSRSHQRPFGWGLAAGPTTSGPQPPNSPPPASASISGSTSANTSNSANATVITNASGTYGGRGATTGGSSALPNNTPPTTYTTIPSMTSNTSAFYRSAMASKGPTAVGSTASSSSNPSGNAAVGVGGYNPSSSANTVSNAQQGNPMTIGPSRSMSAGSVPTGSALNATRATHNTNTSSSGAGGAAGNGGVGTAGSNFISANNSFANNGYASFNNSSSNPQSARENSSVRGEVGGHHSMTIGGEEDDLRYQAPGMIALRGANVMNPSGMTADQSQRLTSLLTGTTSASLLSPPKSSATVNRKGITATKENNPFIADDSHGLQTALRTKNSANQLAMAEVHTKLRLVELFHYWATQPETQAELKTLTDEALKLLSSGPHAPAAESMPQSSAPQKSPRGASSGSVLSANNSGAFAPGTFLNRAAPSAANQQSAAQPLPSAPNSATAVASSTSTSTSPLLAAAPGADMGASAGGVSEDTASKPMSPFGEGAEEGALSSSTTRLAATTNSLKSSFTTDEGKPNPIASAIAAINKPAVGDSSISPAMVGDGMMAVMQTQQEEEAAEPVGEDTVSSPLSGLGSKSANGGAFSTNGALMVELSIDVTPPRELNSIVGGGQTGPISSANSPTAIEGHKINVGAVNNSASSVSNSFNKLSKSPRSGNLALPHPPSANANQPLDASVGRHQLGFHVVDEVDAAHARGGLSPRIGALLTGRSAGGDVSLNGSFRGAAEGAPVTSGSGTTPNVRSAAGTPNRARSPVEHSPTHSGSSLSMLDSNQARPPSPLVDMSGGRSHRLGDDLSGQASGARSPSPSLRDSREGSYSNDPPTTKPATGGPGTLHRSNSGTGQRPNIPKASTPRGNVAVTNVTRALSPPPQAKEKKYATYEDIPRFYFGDGKPDSGRSATIAGPHFRHHENPHLKSFDGIAIPPAQLEQIKAAAAAAEAEKKAAGGKDSSSPAAKGKKKGANLADESTSPGKAGTKAAANSESFSLSTLDPAAFAGLNIPQPGYKLAPMMALVVMEDQDVGTFVQKEFSKVPSPPGPAPVPTPSAAARSTSAGPKGRLGTTGAAAAGKKNSISTTPSNAAAIAAHAKLETQYRTALFTCMTNVVMQAYGLPRYFTSMIMKRLIVDGIEGTSSAPTPSKAVGGTPATAPQAPSTSTPGTSSLGPNKTPTTTSGSNNNRVVPTIEGLPCGSITAAAAKEFYDRFMRFRSPIRRFFEALVACNFNGVPSEAEGANPSSLSFGGGAGASAQSSPLLLNPNHLVQGNSGVNILTIGGGSASNGSPTTDSTSAAATSHQQRNYLVREDFMPYLDSLLELHPGLAFLRQTADFQAKYIETILVRLFFECDIHDRGRISWPEFEKSKLPDSIRQVDVAEDINAVLNFFSYEHFYVIYCRFWELDADRDMLIDHTDLAKYFQEGTANSKVIERIFQGYGRKLMAPPAPTPPTPSSGAKGGKGTTTLAAKRAAANASAADPAGIANKRMGYEDFVWFCLAEEDKSSPRSIRYWFRVLDLDADGVICGWELEQFYNCTKDAMIAITSESISFEDIMCQIVDMVPALSEGHSALDRSFDRQRVIGGAGCASAADSTPSVSSLTSNSKAGVPLPPYRTVTLSDKVRRRSSLTPGPLLPMAKVSSPTSEPHAGATAPNGLPLASPISPVVDDPRIHYHRFGLTLRDLLASPESAHVALNMVLNVVKFLMFEQKDPFVSHHDRLMGGYEGTEWDRFARCEYDRMASEADE